jgi:hypothetical protein
MISYKKIGHFGRLGNQMFQFAATVGIANKAKLGYAFPKENTEIPNVEDFKDGVRREVYFDLPKYFPNVKDTLTPIERIETLHVAQEPYFHFCPDVFTIPDQTNLMGYFQTEKYFEHCSELIRTYFEFNEETKKKSENSFPIFPSHVQFVSIHLRRGDYAGLQQFHPVMDADYYFGAMLNFLEGDYCFLIFSDDIEYAKELFGEQENIVYIEGNDPDVDMCMMSMCHHNVIANSSFSWWGAWLNDYPKKKVIAPKKWFGPAYKGVHDTKDLYPQSWIKA